MPRHFPHIVALICAFVGAFMSQTAVAQTAQYEVPYYVRAVFSVVNGERTGYVELELASSNPRSGQIDVYNLDPEARARGILEDRRPSRAAFDAETKVVDPDGKSRTVKFVRVLRAGPGEQISIGFKLFLYSDQHATVGVVVAYYSEAGELIGRTQPHSLDIYDNQITSKSMTFLRRDLR